MLDMILSYVYIDKLGTSNQDTRSADKKIKLFAEKLFNNRLATFDVPGNFSFENVVGKSPLLEPMSEIIDDIELLRLITKHCSESTVSRANKLYNLDDKTQFNDSIARKLRGALLLKEEWGKIAGNKSPTLYSGASLIARCSDGNPRRLFRIFNHLLSDMKLNENSKLTISPKSQSRKLMSFSFSELEVIKFETKGKDAFDTLTKIGNYLRDKMMNDKIGSDIHRSFKINEHIENSIWENIKTAVDLGLLYPKIKKSQNVQILFPSKEGEFDIANCLSPHFYLLPRTGNSISLTTILNNPDYKKYQEKIGAKQMDFFDDGN
ncbi:hypothetical protein [Psychromonas sp. MME2]|uniref:ORC-CDC6 family AAA ATPase n=1 Tax=Psychromonas sp. MME2 TaxID=3231033 RepID=UPI00339C34C7